MAPGLRFRGGHHDTWSAEGNDASKRAPWHQRHLQRESRNSRAERLAVEEARLAARNARSRTPPGGRQNFDDASDYCSDTLRISAIHFDSVVGSSGSSLVQCCRDSGADIALKPILIDGTDDFMAEIFGSSDAVEKARQFLRAVINDESVEEVEIEEEIPDTSGRAGDIEEEISIPCIHVPFVLSGRRSGEKGMGMSKGIAALEQETGPRMKQSNSKVEAEDTGFLVLKIEGQVDRVAEAKEILNERLEWCEQLIEKSFDCPIDKMPMFSGKADHVVADIERESGACVFLRRGRKDRFQSADGEDMGPIEIIGTQDQTEIAADLVQQRLDWLLSRSGGKGSRRSRR